MKTIPLLLISLISITSIFAEFVDTEFSISPSVNGLPKEAPLTFTRKALILNESIPISKGKELHALDHFSSPQDLVLTGTWLNQVGDFSNYRVHLGNPPGLPDEILVQMTSEDILTKKQDFLREITTFEPLYLIEGDASNVFYLIYRLKGQKISTIYISSVLKKSDDSYVYYGGLISPVELQALFTGLAQEELTKEKCITVKQK